MASEQKVALDDKNIPILSRLRAPAGSVSQKKRVGRGVGSGIGKTSGRGQKGQKARQPGNIHKLHFEGGQMPLNRRLPKHGFNNPFATRLAVVNVGDFDVFAAGTTVDEKALREKGLVKGPWDGVKVLGNGELALKLTIKAEGFSASAKAKIEKAGGTIEVVKHEPKPLVRHSAAARRAAAIGAGKKAKKA
jgi:large subunit ribosomal protein L15